VTIRHLKRARRMSRSVRQGPEVLEFMLKKADVIEAAAKQGIPPVTAVSHFLVEEFGLEPFASMLAKQYCGLIVRAILEPDGYVAVKAGVRVRNDPVFASGAVYEKRGEGAPTDPGQLLGRILDSLSVEEMRWAAQYLQNKLSALDVDGPDTRLASTSRHEGGNDK